MKSSLDINKTLIYGGTFNPPHLGHRKIIQLAVNQFDFDSIMIVPSFQKFFSKSKINLDFNTRVKLSKLNFQNIHSNLFVSDIEQKLEQPVYTYQLISKLLSDKAASNLKSFIFLMGDDQIPSLPKWHQFDELCQLTDFLVASRDDSHLNTLQSKTTKALDELNIQASISENTIKLTEINCTFHFLNNKPIEISSTEIRNSGYSLQNLHPDVMKALKENHVDY